MSDIKQVIICIKDIDKAELIKLSVLAGMQIKDQFNPESPNYLGSTEHIQFKYDYETWIANGYKQLFIEVDRYEDIEFIEINANMENLPVSYLSENIKIPVLVIGPCDIEENKYILNQYI